MITTCTCEHKDQDKIHGNQRRVHTETEKYIGERKVFRCTVCNKERVR